ncbi:unnamed protein product [Sympodiomycopsis kandeliae]
MLRTLTPRSLPKISSTGPFAVRRQLSSSCSPTPSSTTLPPVHVSYIPHLVPYNLGLALQESLYALRGNPEVLLLLQHTPVYTEGRRGDTTDQARLQALGADHVVTQRGGLITYHGPGQLVGYPILHLGKMGLSNRCYVDKLQSSLQAFLHSYSLPTVQPPDDNTGVWIDDNHKIVSIGVQVRHRITSHGFALNVTKQVDPWFRNIVACGIQGKSTTNVQHELTKLVDLEQSQRPDREAASVEGRRPDLDHSSTSTVPIRVETVVPKVAQELAKGLNREFTPAGEDLLRYEADDKNVLQRVWLQGQEIKAS